MFSPTLVLAVLILGFRHGIDWDHIAAISDIISSTKDSKKAILNGFVYALAHGVVIIFLGVLAIVLGVNIPSQVDQLMGSVVGITLIILGVWMLLSIYIRGSKFRLMSRWMLIIEGIGRLYNFLLGKHEHHKIKYPSEFGIKTSYLVGTIHGIGAETPTQVILFITAAGVGGGIKGSILLLVFVIGLLIANFAIVILSLLGFVNAKKNSKLYIIFGVLAGLMSLIVGTLFLAGKSSFLPNLFKQ